jgi:hypothetical protein
MSTNYNKDNTYHWVYSATDNNIDINSEEGSSLNILVTYRLTSLIINLLNNPNLLIYTPNLKSIINSMKNGSVLITS